MLMLKAGLFGHDIFQDVAVIVIIYNG